MAKTMLHTKAVVNRKDSSAPEGVIEAVIGSSNVVDRMGDVIDQSGWDLTNYKNNPVILWGHNMGEERPPIGKALKVWVQDKGTKAAKLMFKVKFDLQDSFAADIYRKVKEGFVNTVSVGFMPIEWESLDEEDPFFGGHKFLKSELLELSFVPVPANPEAVVTLRSMGVEPVEEDTLEKMYNKEAKAFKAKLKKDADEAEDAEKEEVEVPEVADSTEVSEEVAEEEATNGEIEAPVEEKPEGEVPPVVNKDDEEEDKEEVEEEEEKVDEETEEVTPEEQESKKALPYKDLGTEPESEEWDGPGEISKAEVGDLKLMCAWYDVDDEENKGAYKLPHHKADGHKAVWRGVAAAMASLLGARGGVDIPEEDRKAVYNHLVKHYKDFDKEAPEFKAVEDQVLAGYEEEIHAITLDREDKHMVRLIKKVLKEQKLAKKAKILNTNNVVVTEEHFAKALTVIDLALSKVIEGSKKEVKE